MRLMTWSCWLLRFTRFWQLKFAHLPTVTKWHYHWPVMERPQRAPCGPCGPCIRWRTPEGKTSCSSWRQKDIQGMHCRASLASSNLCPLQAVQFLWRISCGALPPPHPWAEWVRLPNHPTNSTHGGWDLWFLQWSTCSMRRSLEGSYRMGPLLDSVLTSGWIPWFMVDITN